MSPDGSIVASFENVESFFAVHTPPDHLIRTDFEQEGVIPEVVSKESGIKDLFGGEICTVMSPGGSIVASFKYVESFFAVHTPPDHLIRTNFEQEGVIPEVVFDKMRKRIACR
ncbi:hypothetical protein Tco_0203148, partial [Tanacetum coccineum]